MQRWNITQKVFCQKNENYLSALIFLHTPFNPIYGNKRTGLSTFEEPHVSQQISTPALHVFIFTYVDRKKNKAGTS